MLVGLSGGSDSVALTRCCSILARTWRVRGRRPGALNHRLRPTADRDEAFCRELATRLEPADRRRAMLDVRDYAADGAAVASRTPRAGCATPSSSERRRDLGGRSHRRRPHAGRPGGDVPAEADARRRADRARRHLSAPRRRRPAAARRLARRPARLPERARRSVGRGRDQRGPGKPAEPRPPRVLPELDRGLRGPDAAAPSPGRPAWSGRTASGWTSSAAARFLALARSDSDGCELDRRGSCG